MVNFRNCKIGDPGSLRPKDKLQKIQHINTLHNVSWSTVTSSCDVLGFNVCGHVSGYWSFTKHWSLPFHFWRWWLYVPLGTGDKISHFHSQNGHIVNTVLYLVSYRMFLLLFPQVWQHCILEGLLLLAHCMTAVVMWATNNRQCVVWLV
jgi:hypothetical protein